MLLQKPPLYRTKPLRLLVLVAVCASGSLAASLRAVADDVHSELVELAASATNQKGVIRFAERAESLPKEVLREFVRSASTDDRPAVRLMSATLLRKFRDEGALRATAARLLEDSSPAVRQVAWLAVDRDALTVEQLERGLASPDLIIRSSAVLMATDAEILGRHMLDHSPLVRALAVRRIARLAMDDVAIRPAIESALARGLVDESRLVRSNAIIAARGLTTWPPGDLATVLLDDRPMLSLEDVLGPEDECQKNRNRLGMDYASYPVVSFFLFKQLNGTIAIIPPPKFHPLVVPLNEKARIGGEAATVFVQAGPANARQTVANIVMMPQPVTVLQQQLKEALQIDRQSAGEPRVR